MHNLKRVKIVHERAFYMGTCTEGGDSLQPRRSRQIGSSLNQSFESPAYVASQVASSVLCSAQRRRSAHQSTFVEFIYLTIAFNFVFLLPHRSNQQAREPRPPPGPSARRPPTEPKGRGPLTALRASFRGRASTSRQTSRRRGSTARVEGVRWRTGPASASFSRRLKKGVVVLLSREFASFGRTDALADVIRAAHDPRGTRSARETRVRGQTPAPGFWVRPAG